MGCTAWAGAPIGGIYYDLTPGNDIWQDPLQGYPGSCCVENDRHAIFYKCLNHSSQHISRADADALPVPGQDGLFVESSRPRAYRIAN